MVGLWHWVFPSFRVSRPRRSASLSLRWRMSVPISGQRGASWLGCHEIHRDMVCFSRENLAKLAIGCFWICPWFVHTPTWKRCETCARLLQMVRAQAIFCCGFGLHFAHRSFGSQKIRGDPNELWHHGFKLLNMECRSVWKYGTPKFWWFYRFNVIFTHVFSKWLLEWKPIIFKDHPSFCHRI